MTTSRRLPLFGAVLLLVAPALSAETRVSIVRNSDEDATAAFAFAEASAPSPLRRDAAEHAVFTVVDGQADRNAGSVAVLHDGKLPTDADQPAANFFFAAGTDGGRLLLDLGKAIGVSQVNTYSWHAGDRAPQVYTLYASDGREKSFNPAPKRGTDPVAVGWKRIADVDTRQRQMASGGQVGVSIGDNQTTIGAFRYLLFDISRTESRDPFGNTFFSEINVLDRTTPIEAIKPPAGLFFLNIADGKYRAVLDTTQTPDLTDWAERELGPVVAEWYPRIVAMLPSDSFQPPRQFTITFHKDMPGVANTAGVRVNCAAEWFRKNLKSEAKGAVVHELVHVVQQYRRARAKGPSEPASVRPGWLVEGIPDYIRWYAYEPRSHGADLDARALARARYDGSYRVSANFLHFVVTHYDRNLITRVNAALRDGDYEPGLWKTLTGKDLEELNTLWKASDGS